MLILILIIISATAIVYSYKDDITKKLLLGINTYTNGELVIQDINVNPLAHFPNISLTLKEPKYFENKISKEDSANHQIFSFSRLHIAFDVLQLLKSNIEITAISMENGSVDIVQLMDSSFNVVHAFQSPDSLRSGIKISTGAPDTLQTASNISFSIKQLHLNNIAISINQIPIGQKQLFKIHELKASIKYVSDSIECKLKTSIHLGRIGLDERISINDEELAVVTDFFYDRADQKINIYQSDIDVGRAQFFSTGTLDFKEHGLIDLSFNANDKDLQFTNLFLTSEGLKNIKKGEIYLKGTLQGKFKDNIPELKCSFGARDLSVQIPQSSAYMENLIIDGSFYSGDKTDFSSATLQIDTLTVQLPSGYVHGSMNLRNLKSPEINYNVDASLNLNDIAPIFEFGPLEDLSGRINLKDTYHGFYQQDQGWIDLSDEAFTLNLDSVSFNLADIMPVNLLDGSISGAIDSLQLDQLYIESRNSDLLLNGSLYNISDFIFNNGNTIEADITIRSDLYDFKEFFTFLPVVAESFPYQIKNVFLNVRASTSYSELTDFIDVPKLSFQIDYLEAEVLNFLPPAKLRDGQFLLYEKDSTSILDFSKFKIEIADAQAIVDFRYNIKANAPDLMEFDVDAKKFNPSKIFYPSDADSIPELLNAEINAGLICDIVLAGDSLSLFESIDLKAENLQYYGSDTIMVEELNLQSLGIGYEMQSDRNLLATLSASNRLHVKNAITPFFKSEELDFSINIEDGQYTIIPHDFHRFGKDENGEIIVKPFENPPTYKLDYSIKELPIEDFLSSFYSERIFSGLVNLDVDLVFSGEDIQEITSSMTGSIFLDGDSLILMGLNLDDLIKNFQRSQSFNLVDIGAVALAGPAGILYSKGSDYAMILATKKGDSTSISKVSSQWNLLEGDIVIKDVAFATFENRVAAKGWLNMRTDSLDVTVGVVDDFGCSIIDQRIYGKSVDPQYGKVKVFKTLLSPVTKLLNKIVDKDCEVFYNGIVQHPQQQTKKE
jgi:hypothetical protein